MAKADFSWSSLGIRLVSALILVFVTYNPEGYSFYHWVASNIETEIPQKVFAGVVLLIGWSIFIRATLHSLGFFGLTLTLAFFGTLVWVIVDWGWIPADSVKVLTYVVLVITSFILTTGISWSFIRRRMSGQYDVVETDEQD